MARSMLAAALLLSLLAGGCRNTPEPEGRKADNQETPTAAPSTPAVEKPIETAEREAPKPRAHWSDPGGWTRVASNSPMRLATYRVPKAVGDPEDGEFTVFHFGEGKGGEVKANLDRWERQFSDVKPGDAKRSERTVNGLKAHVLEIDRGTFASGMPSEAPRSNKGFGLIGAIVETPAGSYFFKLTGPEKTVKNAQGNFYTLLESVKVDPLDK